jgi:hypothetical protein
VPLLAFGRSRGYFTSGGTDLFLSFFAALDVAPARGLTVGSLAQGQRLVLTMDDLSQSLKEYGITVKKVCAQPSHLVAVLTLALATHTARILRGSECRGCGCHAFRVHLVGRHVGVGPRQKEEANQVTTGVVSSVVVYIKRKSKKRKKKTKNSTHQFQENINFFHL